MKTQKKTTIVLRGCLIKVPAKDAAKLQELERESLRNDWNNNQLGE